MTNAEKIEVWFKYHPPSPDQQVRYVAIRDGALTFAKIIVANMGECADQTVALRHIRDAVMSANAGIACGGV